MHRRSNVVKIFISPPSILYPIHHMNTNNKTKLFGLIFLLGIISLFGDIMYEGTRSISGPYLKLLGATAFWVGFIFGLGEFLNYALRIIFGYLVDTTQKYWLFMYLGYGLLFVVPFSLLPIPGMLPLF